MILGVDVDNCLCDAQTKLCDILQDIYGIDTTAEEVMDYDWKKCFDITEQEWQVVLDEFHINCFNVDPIEGAIESIQKLKEFHEIHIITARDKLLAVKPTKKWFKSNKISYDSLTFSVNKLDICLNKNIKLMIEDKGETAQLLAENGITTILLNYPWNSKFNHANIIRVNNWFEIIDILEKDFKSQ